MNSDDAFRRFGHDIESDPIGVLLAKWRRDAFIEKLQRLDDVVEVIPSGSLARGTQIGPVHDVDLIVVFDKSAHPGYGEGSASAREAMMHLQDELRQQMHPLLGADAALPDETEIRNHVVTCPGVSMGPFEGFVPSAPPVDVMPAVRHGSHLRVPELRKDASNWLGKAWVDVHPEKFMHLIEQRQREWKYFKEVIQLVKAWADHNGLKMNTVALETMVLLYCPRPRLFETLTVSEAVTRFFAAAHKAHITCLSDPAGWCGEIDPGMNYAALRSALKEAAGLSREALDAEHAVASAFTRAGQVHDPNDLWQKLFGRKFPRIRFWPAQQYEPWFASSRTAAWRTSDFDPFGPDDLGPEGPNWRKGPNGPKGPDGPEGPDNPNGPQGPNGPNGPQGPNGARSPRGPQEPSAAEPSDPYRFRRPGPARSAPASDLAEPLAGPWTAVFAGAAAVALTAG